MQRAVQMVQGSLGQVSTPGRLTRAIARLGFSQRFPSRRIGARGLGIGGFCFRQAPRFAALQQPGQVVPGVANRLVVPPRQLLQVADAALEIVDLLVPVTRAAHRQKRPAPGSAGAAFPAAGAGQGSWRQRRRASQAFSWKLKRAAQPRSEVRRQLQKLAALVAVDPEDQAVGQPRQCIALEVEAAQQRGQPIAIGITHQRHRRRVGRQVAQIFEEARWPVHQ